MFFPSINKSKLMILRETLGNFTMYTILMFVGCEMISSFFNVI